MGNIVLNEINLVFLCHIPGQTQPRGKIGRLGVFGTTNDDRAQGPMKATVMQQVLQHASRMCIFQASNGILMMMMHERLHKRATGPLSLCYRGTDD